ncbi:g4618 [Coccomyxa elongata]
MSLVISRLRGVFPGDNMSRTDPFVVLMLGHKRTQTKALRRPGNSPVWSGTYEIEGVDNADRDLRVTLYESTPSGAVALGSGIVHLDDTTTPEVVVDIQDSSGASLGRLFFHLDAHGYQLDRPAVAKAAFAGPPASVELLHPEILESGEVDAPNTPPLAAAVAAAPGTPPAVGVAPISTATTTKASTEFVTVSEGDTAPVCGSQTYTTVEDRPVEKELRTTVLEHHTWEKTFVIETRFISERELTDQTRVDVIGRVERVLSVAKSEPCAGAPQLIVDTP